MTLKYIWWFEIISIMSDSIKPLDRVKEAIGRMRGTVEDLTSGTRDTVQSARMRPVQRFRGRGGGPFLASLRKNLDERPKLLDRITAIRDRKEK